MEKLTYVEDYIEFIALGSGVKLARYDVSICHNMALQTHSGISLTDRQAEIAHKIVVKYKKQLASRGVELGAIEKSPVYRLPIRAINRTKEITIVDNQIILRFPYDPDIIAFIKEQGKNIPGRLVFDYNKKVWCGAITEPRLLWAIEFADKYQFTVDKQIVEWAEQVKNQIATNYSIELKNQAGGLLVANAEQSLIDYVNQNLGGFDKNNAVTLIDHSSILGYQVEQELIYQCLGSYNSAVQKLLLKQSTHLLLAESDNFESIMQYARITNRYPIVFYDPTNYHFNSKPVIDFLIERLGNELYVSNSKQKKLITNYKYIYLNNWRPEWQPKIPLLLSMNSFMIGPRKQQIIQCSDKVVYCTEIMYNKKHL